MATTKQKPIIPFFKKLDNKENAFVQEYIIDFNVERAAVSAGYSKTVAHTKAYQWVSNGKIKPHVFNAVIKAIDKRSKRTEITQDRVLEEYAKLGFLDPRQFYDDSGVLIPIHLLSADVAATLTGMDVSTATNKDGDSIDTLKKIKFADKKAALDSVAKHLGMFIERHEHTGKDGKELFPALTDKERAILGEINTK